MRITAAPAAKTYVRNKPRYIPKGDGSLSFHCTPGIRKQIQLTPRSRRLQPTSEFSKLGVK
jgi:hypothetical protein